MLEFQALLQSGDKDAAMAWIDNEFNKNPHSESGAFAFACLMVESQHPGPALFILRQLAHKNPKSAPAFQNLCRTYEEFDMPDEAVGAIKKAYFLKPDSPEIIAGLGCAYTKAQKWERAIEWCNKRLEIGDDIQSTVNLGFCYLSTGRYAEGWDAYNQGIGHMTWRHFHDYGLKNWKGESGKVLFYKEQGIGDQIAFLSCIEDAIADGIVSAVAVQSKLVQLFRDTLTIPVFEDTDVADWVDTIDAEYSAPMSILPQVYRRESFPGTPYLKVNAAKKMQWQALLDATSDKPKIGIAWTGGSKNSAGFRHRNMPLKSFAPLFEMDATFISLQYKDDDTQGYDIHSWPWGTQTDDYSDTAALVSCLDAVVCVPTTAYHLAGALGVPAIVLTHDRPHFHESLPWWNSVTFVPNSTHMDSIQEQLNAYIYRNGREATSRVHSPAIEHSPPREQASSNNAFAAFSTPNLA